MHYKAGYWPLPDDLQFHATNIRFAGSFLATVGWVSIDTTATQYILLEVVLAKSIILLTENFIDNHGSVSMYTDNFLSQKKLAYLSTEKILDKTRCTSEKSYL